MSLRNALRGFMSKQYRFYAVGNSSRAVCSFAAAKVLLFFDIRKFLSINRLRKWILERRRYIFV